MDITIIAPSEIPARRANTLQVMKMAQAISLLGHTTHLIAPLSRSASTSNRSPDASWDSLSRHYGLSHSFDIQWLPALPSLRRYDFSVRSVLQARRWKSDLVYTRLPQAAGISSLLGIPTILEIHDMPQGSIGPWLFRQFLAGTGRRRLVVITAALTADLSQRFSVHLTEPFAIVAPDGVDLERYDSLPTPEQARRTLLSEDLTNPLHHLNPETFTAGYTGHLYPGRGSELLLQLAARIPGVNFLIVGGEPGQVEVLRQAARNQNLSNLILTGFVPNADLPVYQAACELLLMPYQQRVQASSGGDISRYLSPMKLFEYLACERVIISSDLPVLQEVLTSHNALLIPGDQPDAWEAGIRNLMGDPALRQRLASQARKDASRYTWKARALRILEGLAV